jgi:hypothetical protein
MSHVLKPNKITSIIYHLLFGAEGGAADYYPRTSSVPVGMQTALMKARV